MLSAAARPETTVDGRTPALSCDGCGQETGRTSNHQRWCPTCRAHLNRRRNRGTTTERGLGTDYLRRRRALGEPRGEPCPYCGQPTVPGQDLDADHETPRMLGGHASRLRWAHRRCNRQAGARLAHLGRQLRLVAGVGGTTSRVW